MGSITNAVRVPLMAKIRYDKQKGFRIKRGFICAIASGFWYSYKERIWIPDHLVDEKNDGWWEELDLSNSATCKTIRAFRRMLRNNPQVKGKITLIHRIVGYDAYA